MSKESKNKLLNYRVSGDGCPVVFLHGFLESTTMWDHLVIPNGIKSVLVDLPGHGKSKNFKSDLTSMAQMALQVKNVVDELQLMDYRIVGHSMGGYVGLELLQMDERCTKLMLLNSNPWGDSDQKKIDRKRVAQVVKKNQSLFLYEAIPNLFFHPENYDLQVRETIVEALGMDADSIGLASVAMSVRKDHSKWVVEHPSKVVVVQGADDTVVPVKQMTSLLENSEVELHIIEHTGHMAHIEATKEVEGLLEKFIE